MPWIIIVILGAVLWITPSSCLGQSSREVEDNTPVDEKRQERIEKRYKPNSKVKTSLKSAAKLEEEYHKRVKRLGKVYSKYGSLDSKQWRKYISNFGHKTKPKIRPKNRRKLCKRCGIVH